MRLCIGNKNYSSWSMRPWVLMRQAGIAFDEIKLRFDGFDGDSAFKQAVARQTKPGDPPAVRVLGPAECPVFKLQDYYRFHFQLQAENSGVLHAVLREVLTVAKPPSLACGPSWLTWTTLPSWMLVRAPTRMKLTSPRTIVPGQIETSSPSTTSPITVAAGST